MTQQSAVLLIAFLGIVVAAVLLGTATRKLYPDLQWASRYWRSRFGCSISLQARAVPCLPPRISQCDAGSALVWLNVWRLHRGFFPCPRIYLRGHKKASKACLGLGDCRFPHTQFHWIHPLFSVPRASPWALQLLWQAYSRGRSILQPLRILAGFFVSNASQLTITQNGGRYET